MTLLGRNRCAVPHLRIAWHGRVHLPGCCSTPSSPATQTNHDRTAFHAGFSTFLNDTRHKVKLGRSMGVSHSESEDSYHPASRPACPRAQSRRHPNMSRERELNRRATPGSPVSRTFRSLPPLSRQREMRSPIRGISSAQSCRVAPRVP